MTLHGGSRVQADEGWPLPDDQWVIFAAFADWKARSLLRANVALGVG